MSRPYGLKALHLLKAKGFAANDHWLRTRAETDRFKADNDVTTTPQIFIGGRRIGGYDDLRRYFGLRVPEPGAISYTPVITLFAMTALMAMAASLATMGTIFTVMAAEWFISFSMCALALLSCRTSSASRPCSSITTCWRGAGCPMPPSILSRKDWPAYLMTAHALDWISIPVALFIGTVGATSVFKAVYIDKRSLKCACVGGNSNVPLGFVSLTENLMMIAMAIWMAIG